jgi:large subunit ribosomal protein L10
MPLTPDKKKQLIDDYEKGLAAAPHAFLLDYKGITVPQVTTLRSRVRDSGGHYEVVKNTLALRAIDGKALAELKEHFVGPTAVVYSMNDPVALAKALTDFAKDVPAMQFKAGLVESRMIAANQIKDIASLPSREQLLTKLVFLLQSPITRFARVLAAVPQQFVVVLDQVRQQKEGGAAAPEAGATASDAPDAAAATPENAQ